MRYNWGNNKFGGMFVSRYLAKQMHTKISSTFSTNFNWNHWSSHQFFESLKKVISSDPSFIRLNKKKMTKYMIDLMEAEEFSTVSKVAKQLPYWNISEWNHFIEIRQVINKCLANPEILKAKSKYDKGLMIQAMKDLNYQPLQQDQTLLENYVKGQLEKGQIKNLEYYSVYYLGIWPSLFIEYREQLEAAMLRSIRDTKIINTEALLNGFISGFWTHSFVNQLKNLKIQNQRLKIIQNFTDLTVPNQIQRSSVTKRSQTEAKIGEILRDLGYVFKQNWMINGMEIDFMFPNNYLLEFNGIFHYNIGTEPPRPIKKEQWRNDILLQRNFTRCIIPFYEWQKLNHQKSQRAFLISRIEFVALKQLLDTKQLERLKKLYKKRKPIVQ